MPRNRNIKNLKTEKEGILILKEKLPNFYTLDSDELKHVYSVMGIDYQKYHRSVDGVILNVDSIKNIKKETDVMLIEIKTTKSKKVKELPYGVFFGITQNEEELFRERSNYRLCIVHSKYKDYVLLTYNEYDDLINNKRVQFQVNFKTKEKRK